MNSGVSVEDWAEVGWALASVGRAEGARGALGVALALVEAAGAAKELHRAAARRLWGGTDRARAAQSGDRTPAGDCLDRGGCFSQGEGEGERGEEGQGRRGGAGRTGRGRGWRRGGGRLGVGSERARERGRVAGAWGAADARGERGGVARTGHVLGESPACLSFAFSCPMQRQPMPMQTVTSAGVSGAGAQRRGSVRRKSTARGGDERVVALCGTGMVVAPCGQDGTALDLQAHAVAGSDLAQYHLSRVRHVALPDTDRRVSLPGRWQGSGSARATLGLGSRLSVRGGGRC
eukprot:3404151-Rhodomonas_salina.1